MDTLYIPVFSVGRGKLVPDFQDKVAAENQTQMLVWQPTQGPLCPGPGAGYLRRYVCSEIRRARAIENLVMN